MANQEKEVLDFGIFVDIRDSLKAIEKFQRKMTKSMKAVAESGEKMGKAAGRAARKATEETEELVEAVEDVGKAYEGEAAEVSNLTKTIRELQAQSKLLHGDEKKAVLAQIKTLKRVEAERKKATGGGATPPKGGMFFGRFTPEKVRKELLEAGRALKEPLRAFLAKDAKGLVEGSMKGAGAVLSRSVKFSGIMAGMGAGALGKRGEQASARGKAMGGARGAAAQAGGAGMKAMAGMLGKLGSSLEFLTKLGPLLGTISGAVVGLVKLFLDADAMVKDLNKEILQSASNIEYLEQAGWSAEGAISNMEDSLRGIRTAALDASFNNALGITKETHTGILNVLTQEGVALGNLSAEAGNTVKGMEALTKTIVTMGVGYSRALGVPLQEINQLQAEMMTEMGNNVEGTRVAFSNLARAAAGSGIAGNKFFAIVRAASQDLSLWNLRMESAVDLLGKLGKTMSPRAAQSFFQTISSGFKNMGRQDLLKQTLMAGVENVRGVLKTEVGEQQKELAQQIAEGSGQNVAEVLKVIQTEGYRGADRLIRSVKDVSKIGTLREKAASIERKSQGVAGGTFELSQASGEMTSVYGQVDILTKAVERLGGTLLKPNEMALAQTAENQNLSREQINQLHGLALAVDTQRKILLENAKGDASEMARINGMSTKEIIASDKSLMSSSEKLQQDQTKAQQTVQEAIGEMSKAQGQQTQSIFSKLSNLVDWFMGVFYNLMIDIWDGVMSIGDLFGDAEDKETKKAVYKSGNMDLINAMDRAKGKAWDFKGELFKSGSKFSKDLGDALNRGNKENATVDDRVASGSMESVISQSLGSDVEKVMAAAGAAIRDQGKLNTIRGVVEKGGNLEEGLDAAQVTGTQRADAFHQAAGQLLPSVMPILARSIGRYSTMGNLGGGGDAAPAAGPAPIVAETEKTNDHLVEVARGTNDLHDAVRNEGVKLDPGTTKNVGTETEKAMLSALRVALFEYYLYSGTDRGTLLASMGQGGMGDPRAMASYFGRSSVAGGSTLAAMEGIATGKAMPGNASGGLVTGIANGMALVAAQGEGLASVGRGERILPAGGGGGGGGVNVVVNGIGGRELANLIEGKVVEGIRDYKRREKFY